MERYVDYDFASVDIWINAKPSKILKYVRDMENLYEWTGVPKDAVKREGDHWRAFPPGIPGGWFIEPVNFPDESGIIEWHQYDNTKSWRWVTWLRIREFKGGSMIIIQEMLDDHCINMLKNMMPKGQYNEKNATLMHGLRLKGELNKLKAVMEK